MIKKLKNLIKSPLKIAFIGNFLLIYRSLIIFILIAGFFITKFAIEQKKSEIIDNFTSDNSSVEKSISQNINYLKYQLFYANSQIIESNAYNNKEKIEKILSSFIGGINKQIDVSITWNSFSWIDKNDFLTVDGAIGIIANPIDLKKRDYLKLTKKTPNKLVFGSLIRGALSDRLVIPISMGVFSYRGDYQGSLMLSLDVARITEKIENSVRSQGMEFFILIEDQVFFSSKGNPMSKDISRFISQNKTAKNYLLDQSKIFNSEKAKIVSISQINETPLKIVSVYYQKDFYDKLAIIALKSFLYISLATIILFLFFQKIYQRIIKPIDELSKSAIRIAKKDFEYKIEKPLQEEFSDLHKSLLMLRENFKKEEELIQNLQKSKDDLTQANQAKINLISSISHDIKNYIFGISGLSEVLISDQENNQTIDADSLDILRIIKQQSDELRFFVEDLLEANQVKYNKISLNKTDKIDLANLIKSAIIINHKFAAVNKIKIISNLDDSLIIKADKRRIKQVLLNLINNAVKYSKVGGIVEVKSFADSQADQIIVEVIDKGYGMDEYELFNYLNGDGEKIDKSHIKKDKKDFDSHSIGMKNVIEIVNLHNAEIKAESVKNKGTKVSLIFNNK